MDIQKHAINNPVIHVMNRAPEETINRMSPCKHAHTGMVGSVPMVRAPMVRALKGALYVARTGCTQGKVLAMYRAHTVPRTALAP